ncbi:sugar phosphate isomerase/epimerase family protein [Actinomycetospora termitidis]|uniref:Sugar phosphate isomerase/epimerase n=1 Tax=Actinomycetospora termitidis TaxID=3053470 RepID=A0ABT7MGU4_9PSEU|nr:sugar phosphate isomerase/epimerase [Actinomycetospora sp. Odt1-22]MDL5159656.1 sugar phosphate isomerase/epimerase [Actinomycetospora sp. Odt1-22]
MSLLAGHDLVASYFTLTGAHLSRPPRHDLAARATAAAAAGFTGLALAPAELPADGDPSAVVAAVASAGLAVPELEPLRGWDSGDHGQEAAVFALADAFGSRQVTTIRLVGDEVPDDLLAERFAGLAARAAEHGLTVGLEPRAHSPMATPDEAAALIVASGAANAGIVLDAYHVHRAGVGLDDLARVTDRIASIQLNDMLAVPREDPAQDALEYRLVPGAGVIDLTGWLAGLDGLGVRAPLAVEALSRELNDLPVHEAAHRAAEGARSALAAARRPV